MINKFQYEHIFNLFNSAMIFVDSKLIPSRYTTCLLDADTSEKARDQAGCHSVELVLVVGIVAADAVVVDEAESSCLRYLELDQTLALDSLLTNAKRIL